MNPVEVKRTTLWVFMAALFALGALAFSQDAAAPPVAASGPGSVAQGDAELQTLLAPIALYPDPLLAQILPASTYPLQIVVAQRWLQANPNPTQAAMDAQDLEPSVKALLHYPSILEMMSNRVLWTQLLGSAFLNQQADVMTAVQELRAQAQRAGSLQSTPQQQVVTDDDAVEILPVNPDVIYVPEYDPQTIYVGPGVGLTFGMGYPEGLWLNNNADWHHRWVAGGDGWHHGWDRSGKGGRRPGEPPPMTKPWERNGAQPLPLRTRPPIRETPRGVGPGYETPVKATPAPSAFRGYQNRSAVQQQVNRAQQSRPAPQQARPAPQARPTPAQVFHAQGSGRSVTAQSARGNASRSGGGGGGGGRRK